MHVKETEVKVQRSLSLVSVLRMPMVCEILQEALGREFGNIERFLQKMQDRCLLGRVLYSKTSYKDIS
jgi:hypothetical protein